MTDRIRIDGATVEDRLLPHHLASLRDQSGLTDTVILARGYYSVETLKEARDLGFSEAQSNTPALAVPLWDTRGQRAGTVLRPDTPRVNRDGKTAKYEQRRGKPPVLDVPPTCQPNLGDPDTVLFITEGAKKADALAARGACAINLGGVWNWRGRNAAGGLTALADWEDIALADRLVRIVFDSDVAKKSAVAVAMLRLKRFLERRRAHVQVVYLPDSAEGRKQGVDDFLATGASLAEVATFARDAVELPKSEASLPEIVTTGRHLPEVVQDAWAALLAWRAKRGLPIFERVGFICRIDRSGHDGARIRDFARNDLAFVMNRCATWMREPGPNAGMLLPDRAPRDILDDMLVAWQKPLPHLEGVVGTPVFAPDGTLDTTPGYQQKTKLYYAPVGEPVVSVPAAPTEHHLSAARDLLLDNWLVDIPFVDRASRAHLLAACITPLVRELFTGATPLFAIDAPVQGTGKGLLAQTAGVIVSGRPPAVTTMARDQEEERKRYTALLREGAGMILVDNVKSRLDSPVLAAALTAEVWRDRILGVTETVALPNRALWFVTGNNLEFDGEIARRALLCRLDSRVDRPWERKVFKHPELLRWVSEHRHDLVWSLAVLCQHWLATGRPPFTGTRLGSFESWCEVVGGVLQAAGIDGFLANREQMYRQADAESEEWRVFVQAWWDEHGDGRVKGRRPAHHLSRPGPAPDPPRLT